MRFTAALACINVALDCTIKAAGDQVLFAERWTWLWAIGAVLWLIFAVQIWMFGTDT